MNKIENIIAYYRMSESELNAENRNVYTFEDQRRDVTRFAAQHHATIIAEFSEVASGMTRWQRRKELRKAVRWAFMQKATLVVGRQDRLACKVRVICDLLEEKFDFISVDSPHRDRCAIHFQVIYDEEYADEGA